MDLTSGFAKMLMGWFFSTLGTGIVAFATTNIDDIFLLALFFSQANSTFRKRHIVTGQYLGFLALIGISVLITFGTLTIPRELVGLLGIVPFIMGIVSLLKRHTEESNAAPNMPLARPSGFFATLLNPRTYSVAAITLANGGDNISIYVPLFRSAGLEQTGIIVAVFLLLVGVWCFLGYTLVRFPLVAQTLRRIGHILTSFVLIGLGIFILVESGTVALLIEAI